MISIENRSKGWLNGQGPKPPLGTWLMAAAPTTAEAMGYSGFDFLVVDMEHVPLDLAECRIWPISCAPSAARRPMQ